MMTKKEKELAKKSLNLSLIMYIVILLMANIFYLYTRNMDVRLFPLNIIKFIINSLTWSCVFNAITYNLLAEITIKKFSKKKENE